MKNHSSDHRPRILIVEDENIVALDIESGLKRLGYDVIGSVNNGNDAIKQVELNQPDLVLMDIKIQGPIDGIETADRIRKMSGTPVVFLTAYADEATLQRAKSAEPYGYLLKPFDDTMLHTAIEVVLAKHGQILTQVALSSESLKLSEERFNIFVDANLEYSLFMLNGDGKIVSWNIGAERITGYKSDEVMTKHISLFYSEDDRKSGKPEAEMKIASTTGKFSGENWRVRKDGSRFWAEVIMTALFDNQGKLRGFGNIMRDLTLKKSQEEHLRQAIVARDEFMSIASHELRTPISVLSLQIQVTKKFRRDSFKHDPELESFLEKMSKQVLALSKLVDELLDVTRIEFGKVTYIFEKCDLSEIVGMVCHDFSAAFEASQMKLECDLHKRVEGTWDRIRIGQVAANLISNALKYAPGNPVKVFIESDTTEATIVVQDFGPGIPKDMQSKIFERFGRVGKPAVSGLGLGLYISRQIVEGHGGKIFVESDPGKGCVFKVVLPREKRGGTV